jgi:hypothetical protein
MADADRRYLVWGLPYAPAIGHPARLSGRKAVVDHVTRFLGAVEKFRFFDLKVYAFAKAEAFLRVYFDPTRAAKARTTFPCPKV